MEYWPFYLLVGFILFIVLVIVYRYIRREHIRRKKYPRKWIAFIQEDQIKLESLPFKDNKAWRWEDVPWPTREIPDPEPTQVYTIAEDAQPYLFTAEKKSFSAPLIDPETKISTDLYFDPALDAVLSNPSLNGQLIDAVMLTDFFQISPSQKKRIIVCLIMLFIGYFIIGGIFFHH